MPLSEKEAERLADALENAGFDADVDEEKLPTGRFFLIVYLEEGQTATDVGQALVGVPLDPPNVEQPKDCPAAVLIS